MRQTLFRKKVVATLAIVVAFAALALVVLLYVSNRIIETELQKTLGKGSRIGHLSLGWTRVEARDVHLERDGQGFFDAKRVEVRASFFTLFGNKLAVSQLTIEQPSVSLQLDAAGTLVNPFTPSAHGGEKETQEAGKTESVRPIEVGRLLISDGALTIRDGRRTPGPILGTIEITGLQADLGDVAFPLKNAASKVSLRMNVKGKPFSGSVTCTGSVNPLTLAGSFALSFSDIQVFQDDEGPESRAASLRLTASSQGADSTGAHRIVLADVTLDRPFLRVEQDKSGRLTSPQPPTPASGAKENEEKKWPVSLTMNRITVAGGEVLFLDGKIARPPYPLRFTDIALTADSCSFPPSDTWTAWQASARLQGKASTGQISGAGRTNLRTLDTSGKLSLRRLDILSLKPYLQKKGEADVRAGTLDLDMDIAIRHKSINAPTHAVLRNLQFAHEGSVRDQFLGVPRSLVVRLLESSKNEIPLDFAVEGSLDNPQFSLRENFVRRFSVGLGQKLGLGTIQTGEEAVKQGGKVLKGIGQSLRGLFK